MKKISSKSCKGAISIFVLMSMLFFLFVTIGIFSVISRRAQAQTETLTNLKDKYYQEGMEDQFINNRVSNNDKLIPIYNSEQLLAIGISDKKIEIDGKIYDFSQNDYSRYELKNDIIISTVLNSATELQYLSNEQYDALNRHNYEILYYDTVGGKYYQIAREDESAVNLITSNGVKLAIKYLDASKIKEDPTTYYGCYVNYQAQNSSIVNWRIFYAGTPGKINYEDNDYTDNIYLIADNYISYNYVPNGKNGTPVEIGINSKCISMENVINDYSGMTDIISDYANLNTIVISKPECRWLKLYIDEHYSSTSNNIKAVAYMMDRNVWSRFKGEKADYAIGGPTLEMFIVSNNDNNSVNLNAIIKDEYGYQIKKATDENYVDNISNVVSESNSLYVLSSTTQSENCNAMWIASPSSAGADKLMTLSYTGSIENASNSFNDIGFRPIVCLSSDAVLSRNIDGTYNIK